MCEMSLVAHSARTTRLATDTTPCLVQLPRGFLAYSRRDERGSKRKASIYDVHETNDPSSSESRTYNSDLADNHTMRDDGIPPSIDVVTPHNADVGDSTASIDQHGWDGLSDDTMVSGDDHGGNSFGTGGEEKDYPRELQVCSKRF